MTCQGPTPYQMLFLTFFVKFTPHCKPSVFHLTYGETDAEARSFKVTQQVATLGFGSG